MPSLVTVPRCIPVGSCTAPALVVALAATVGASSLGAQAPTFGTDINAAAETPRDRAPLFFGSAGVAPDGYLAVSMLGVAGSSERRIFMPGGPGTQYSRAWTTTLSVVWGATSRLTLGAQAGAGGATREIEWTEAPTEPGGVPQPRRDELTELEIADVLRLHARYQLRSGDDGRTQVALSGSLAWPNRYRGYATIGLAVAKRVGPASLHAASDVRFHDGIAGTRSETIESQTLGTLRARAALDLRTAVVVPLGRRVAWSLEGLGTNMLAPSGMRVPAMIEAGTGLRFDLGRAKLDLGYRERLDGNTPALELPQRRLLLGTHWTF